MSSHYEQPFLDKEGFTCPHCGAYSAMGWEWLRNHYDSLPLKRASCHKCKQFSIWRVSDGESRMVDPIIVSAPLPSEDLPESCRKDYQEAREIADKSPRGAAALLRLCIQKLCKELGGKGKNINDDIAVLVKNGLPVKIQQALDVVRVVGNNAVHPGEISLEDHPQVVTALFNLINMIVDNQITQPKQVAELFAFLPEGAKSAVEKRDTKA
ncbi:hypothetical protein M445_00400 [Vibrio owensii 47666-1]|uniref:DUF4145 domain-containing protein n=1 Tax=Vibrio harveyi group TaxID=717610 RepID=UPI00046F44E9|nr:MULTISPECIES: DUF4145 domain-containing protein [Vibrio harveyi group]KIF50328.1 hypothetical protein M445_00400 [Vibrio owensii 47666-1]